MMVGDSSTAPNQPSVKNVVFKAPSIIVEAAQDAGVGSDKKRKEERDSWPL